MTDAKADRWVIKIDIDCGDDGETRSMMDDIIYDNSVRPFIRIMEEMGNIPGTDYAIAVYNDYESDMEELL